ncbi:MAG: hypothetical protein WB994_12310 [Candidatus Acidiferrum sp.]
MLQSREVRLAGSNESLIATIGAFGPLGKATSAYGVSTMRRYSVKIADLRLTLIRGRKRLNLQKWSKWRSI